MQPGDLVRWRETGQITIYLGMLEEGVHRFHSPRWGYVGRWNGAFGCGIEEVVEVISGSQSR